ncbi:hypothetical protein EYZ11_004222 [Aspergillus tanneri]|uniref:Cytochrome P450 n=1 Tax=Aspergillus tanneri TaxID=1220188 RepID=A0A4S3JNI3_9EURO|nr:hypothetical protein EYZ11_004222 [Aspergillus tanneri]
MPDIATRDFVRYGPNRILVNSAAGLKDIYGHGKNVRKSPAYRALIHRVPSTFTLVDKREHSWKRRILAQGFTTSTLRDLEPHILGKIDRFCKCMLEHGEGRPQQGGWSSPQNLSDWCSYLSFEIMASVVFGQKYDMLGSEEHRHLIKDIQKSNIRVSVLYNYITLRSLHLDRLLFPESMKGRRHSSNLFHLLKTFRDPESGRQFHAAELRAEAATLIAADADTCIMKPEGLETTSSAMAATFFYLSHFPVVQSTLAEEIRTTFDSVDSIHMGPQLKSCRYLDACIYESLRMSPPVSSPTWRQVENRGALIDGRFLEPGCDVGTSIYAIHHNPRIFQDHGTFDPSRWLEPDSRAIRAAFAPFSIGPRACVGRSLALAELAMVVASVVWRYDLRLADGSLGRVGEGGKELGRGRERVQEFQLYDHIAAATDGPYVEFRAREA